MLCRTCHSNFDTAIAEGTDCLGQADPDLYCRQQEVEELEYPVRGYDETTATARCTQLADGTSGCRKAYYMPCQQDSDCPTSFT